MNSIISNNVFQSVYHYLYNLFIQIKLGHATRIDEIKIRKLKNKFKGQRCFIIGNGPSLNKTDLSLLKDEYTFGLNRIYLYYKKMGYKTTFLVCVNKLVQEQFYKDFNKISNVIKFFSKKSNKLLSNDNNTFFLHSLTNVQFSTDLRAGVWEGATVTYVAMQIAYYLGFKEIVLIGVDHNFTAKGKPHCTKIMKTEDHDHFDSRYFKGYKWQLPDLKTSELAYRIGKYHFQENNIRIINCTVGGELEVYPRIKLEKYLENSK